MEAGNSLQRPVFTAPRSVRRMETRVFTLSTCTLACCESVSLERRNLITAENDQVSPTAGRQETGHLGSADSPAPCPLAALNEPETQAV